ncbi:HupE / UreJ protein [Roseovarius albus]|uniref:HupE / UreJ protein n=1 Tax=Roseovarius albus TaxID=1247867 RepID=A0A1X6Z8Q4_9RHOB|nr:HupE/UreJ family protein [Roseovarius albus]SLN44558.1 HupE / UreJ protein [Roseovarius albus]
MIGVLQAFACLIAVLLGGQSAQSHTLEPGYLQLTEIAPDTWQVFWRKPDVKGKPMAIDAQLPEVCEPSRGAAPQFDGQAWGSAWVATCDGGLKAQLVTIPGLEAQRTDVLMRVEFLEGPSTLAYRFTPSETVFVLPEEQTILQILWQYGQLGFEHILEGWDHLLFVFALLILIQSPGRLIGAVTAFTVAHSITLALATLGWVNMPGPPVEAVIALSIVFLAVEILKTDPANPRLSARFPWVVSFLFGLLHGLGFAGALSEIGLPEGDIPAALLAFNLGVEAGQLTFVLMVISAFAVVRILSKDVANQFRTVGAPGYTAMGYAIGCVSMYWLVERVSGF